MAAYIVGICEVTNPNDNFKKYSQLSAELMAEHGGKYAIRGPASEVKFGDVLKGKVVVMNEFPSMEALNAFLNDPRYVEDILPLREGTGNYEIATYEGAPS